MAEKGISSVGSRTAAGIGPGDVVAEKYRVEQVLGEGGMGVVFMARHIHLDEPVALKVLSPDLLDNEQAVARFRREAQAAAKLKNEHVVRVFDVGVHEGALPYLVMEYLEGGDLARMIRSAGALSVEQAADVLIQACSAVNAAHRLGIIHRDLKPSNLFCVPRADGWFTVKVVDFGISRVSAGPNVDDQGITVTGSVVGSPSYMSPEQMRSAHRVDARTDIWSLGVVLYECLTGKLPFPAVTYAEVCVKVTQDPPEPLAGREPPIPPALVAVVLRCLEKDRERRFGTAAELALALVEFAPPSARHLAESLAFAGGRATAEPRITASSAPPIASTRTSNQPTFTRTAHVSRSRPLPWLVASLGVGAVLAAATWFALARSVNTPEASKTTARDEHAASSPSVVLAPAVEVPQRAPAATSAEPVAPAPSAASGADTKAAPPARVAPAGTSRSVSGAKVLHPPSQAQPAVASSAAASSSSHAPAAKPLSERNSRSGTWQR